MYNTHKFFPFRSIQLEARLNLGVLWSPKYFISIPILEVLFYTFGYSRLRTEPYQITRKYKGYKKQYFSSVLVQQITLATRAIF